ncbi:rab11 family-interacting protein 4B-like isoform X7 [Macrobrachium rosenbergii]|uniref:rab11 family-interacting protein 4B-like isoform X7 n=1 Tax=Macrobrachium rosenbergii TaxID=79674 RepID=UPI0034D72982
MAVSEKFLDQLRQVFEVCDVEQRGTISLRHLLHLAGEHFGSSQNSVTAAVASLGVSEDAITFPQFCEVVATILTQGGMGEDGGDAGEDTMDGIASSRMTGCTTDGGDLLSELDASGGGCVSGGGVVGSGGGVIVDVDEVRRMPGDDRGSPSSLTDLDSAFGASTASPDSTRKTHSGCSSMSDRDEEVFACNGEADDLDCDSDTAQMGAQEKIVAPRRWGSFRQSVDVSQEDPLHLDLDFASDPDYLRAKVQMLQQQVGVLAENQVNSDDRFSRVKQDNAAYQARVVMLEEQLRETELRSEERQAEEQRRSRELINRIEREKQLTIENYTIKLASLEKEKKSVEEEGIRLKSQLEKLQKEKESLEDRVSEAEFSASALHQENSKLAELSRREKEEIKVERERSAQVIEELRCEIERLRTAEENARKRSPSIDPQNAQSAELQATIKQLREENKNLVEQVEDLQAQLLHSRLEEGRVLVTATNNNSLAAEFEAMSSEEGALYGSDTVEKLKKSLKDAQEANQHLRAYIDGILLNIVENYPQLLEVKQK